MCPKKGTPGLWWSKNSTLLAFVPEAIMDAAADAVGLTTGAFMLLVMEQLPLIARLLDGSGAHVAVVVKTNGIPLWGR